MKKLLLISGYLILSGCTTSMKMAEQVPSRVEQIDFKNYEIDKRQKAFVGEQIIARKSYKAVIKSNLVKAMNDFTLSGGVATTSINLVAMTGDTFRIAGYNELNNPVVNIPGSNFMFGIDSNGNWDMTVMSPSFWTSPIGSGSQYNIFPENTTFQKVESTMPFSEAGYINHEIVFTGIGASGLNLIYREYTFENMARSDFKQELIYPIDTKQIRFRNYLISVHSVDSSEIEYTVAQE